MTRYLGLELADPETGQTVFRASVAELTLPVSGRGAGQLVLVEPQIAAERADTLRQLLFRAMRNELGQRDLDLRISAATVEIDAASGPVVLSDLSGGLKLAAIGGEAWIRFHPAPTVMAAPRAAAEPVHMKVVRNRGGDPRYTGFELSTHGAELSCDVWLELLGIDAQLGRRARFRGLRHDVRAKDTRDVVVVGTDEGWTAAIGGSFIDVDLQRLLGPGSPHRMEGRATLDVTSAWFERGRLVEAECTLVGDAGRVSRSLLAAAIDELAMRGAEPPASAAAPPRADLVPYEQLAATAKLDREGVLTITGHCERAAGVLLSGPPPERSLLLVEAESPRQPVTALVRTLSPPADTREAPVPATRRNGGVAPLAGVAGEFGGVESRSPKHEPRSDLDKRG